MRVTCYTSFPTSHTPYAKFVVYISDNGSIDFIEYPKLRFSFY